MRYEIIGTDEWKLVLKHLNSKSENYKDVVVAKSRKGNEVEVARAIGALDGFNDAIKFLQSLEE